MNKEESPSSAATDGSESATNDQGSESAANHPGSESATNHPASGSATNHPGSGSTTNDPVTEHVRWAVANWPQIDPEVEGIVTRVDKISSYLHSSFRASLGDAGLTKDEWKVLMALHDSVRSHGWLCRDLNVSTGAMTNRLDKLERVGLIRRAPDPQDRRGVLLELTAAGHSRVEEYIDASAGRERELLAELTLAEKQELNQLLSKLLVSLQTKDAEGQSPKSGGHSS